MSENPFPVRPTAEMRKQADVPVGAPNPSVQNQGGGFSPQMAQNPPAKEEEPRPSGFLRQTEDLEEAEDARAPSHHQLPAPVPSGDQQDSRNAGPPPLQMDEKSCRTCGYFDFPGKERERVAGGECRRNAPSIAGGKNAAWPAVKWNAWCGEWELGVSDDDMVRMARDVADRSRATNEV